MEGTRINNAINVLYQLNLRLLILIDKSVSRPIITHSTVWNTFLLFWTFAENTAELLFELEAQLTKVQPDIMQKRNEHKVNNPWYYYLLATAIYFFRSHWLIYYNLEMTLTWQAWCPKQFVLKIMSTFASKSESNDKAINFILGIL